MKVSTKLIFALLIILPFVSATFFYWAENLLEELNINSPHEKIVQFVESSDDIEWIRNSLKTRLDFERETEKAIIEAMNSFASMLMVFAICNAVFLYFFYRDLINMVSNKQLEGDNSPSAPTSKP